jgi:pimeloyl-ACP methyl ester carboxylesterase
MKLNLFVFAVVWLSVCLIVQPAFAQETDPDRTAVDKMVDVGGYKLHFRHTPGILPAIVFESGGGAAAWQWANIQQALSTTTKNALVSYDRAGHARSELPDTEYDLKSEMTALHVGLEKLGVADEIVLVGHSYAGFLMTMYTHLYPDSVKSLLYIDPNTVTYALARTEIQGPPVVDPDDIPKNKYDQAMRRQLKAFPETLETMKSVPWPTQPYFVIAAGERWMDTDELNDAFRQGHEELTKHNGTELIIAEGSDHFVPRKAQDLVLRIINDLLTKTD